MNILLLLIPMTILVVAIAIYGLLWAIRSGQFDDMEGPAYRILMDEDDPRLPDNYQLNEKKALQKQGNYPTIHK